MNHNNIEMQYECAYPPVQEAEEWEKYQKSIKGIYTGIKRMRYIHSARETNRTSRSSFQLQRDENSDNDNKDGFYITWESKAMCGIFKIYHQIKMGSIGI